MLVASDARLTRAGSPQETTYGDGAAALLLGPSSPTALATVLAARSVASDFVDHYRMSGAHFDYALEERWVRDELLLRMPNVVAELLAEAEHTQRRRASFRRAHRYRHRETPRRGLRTSNGAT